MSLHVAETIGWLALSVLCVTVGLSCGYLLWRLGRLIRRLDGAVHEVTDETIPLITKAGVSMDTINSQLQKVDTMMDSAVDLAQSVDGAVRAVSMAVTEPVKRVSAAFAGVGGAASGFRDRLAEEWSAGADPEEGFAGDGTDLFDHPLDPGGEG